MKEDYDGAEPTASSVSVLNLLVLSHLVDEPALDASRSSGRSRCSAQRLEQIGRARADDGGGAVGPHRRPAADRHRQAEGDDAALERDRRRSVSAVCD